MLSALSLIRREFMSLKILTAHVHTRTSSVSSTFESGKPASVVLALKDAFHDVSDVRPFHLPHIFEPKPRGDDWKQHANRNCQLQRAAACCSMPGSCH